MAIPTSKTSPIRNKREGTSQTFGQLIVIPSKKDIGSVSVPFPSPVLSSPIQIPTVIAQDTIVKIIPNELDTSSFAGDKLTDTDKSKIAIAAVSDNKEPSVSINKASLPVENALEGSILNSFSKVKQNILNHAIVLGSMVKSKEEVKKALTEAEKVDMMISLRSKDSEDLEFNNLKEPSIDGNFTYNFFIPEESDIVSQEDQSQDPLLKRDVFNVPRFVKLTWTPVSVTEELTGEETGKDTNAVKMKKEAFGKKKGVLGFNSLNFKESFEKSKKKTNLLNKEGIKMEVVDIHKLDVAFEATSNKKVFSNSLSAVFNISDQANVLPTIPIKLEDQ